MNESLNPLGVPMHVHNELCRREPEIRAARERTRTALEAERARKAEREAREAEIQGAHQALMALADGITRAVLNLHEPKSDKCEGCDIDGYECEPPAWPCSTYTLVAESLGATFTTKGWHTTMTVPEEKR